MFQAAHMRSKWFVLFLVASAPLHAQTPEWIWFSDNANPRASDQVRYFRKVFEGRQFTKAILTIAGDDRATAFLNGKQVAENRNWKNPVSVDVTREVKQGQNVLALRGRNNNSAAGVIAKLEFT